MCAPFLRSAGSFLPLVDTCARVSVALMSGVMLDIIIGHTLIPEQLGTDEFSLRPQDRGWH
eukprot:10586041-Karenia_brevis.AAC.1